MFVYFLRFWIDPQIGTDITAEQIKKQLDFNPHLWMNSYLKSNTRQYFKLKGVLIFRRIGSSHGLVRMLTLFYIYVIPPLTCWTYNNRCRWEMITFRKKGVITAMDISTTYQFKFRYHPRPFLSRSIGYYPCVLFRLCPVLSAFHNNYDLKCAL